MKTEHTKKGTEKNHINVSWKLFSNDEPKKKIIRCNLFCVTSFFSVPPYGSVPIIVFFHHIYELHMSSINCFHFFVWWFLNPVSIQYWLWMILKKKFEFFFFSECSKLLIPCGDLLEAIRYHQFLFARRNLCQI